MPSSELLSPQMDTITAVYEVVWHRGAWRILHIGKHSKPYPDQQAAILAAIAVAKTAAETTNNAITQAQVRLVRTDGRIVMCPLEESVLASP